MMMPPPHPPMGDESDMDRPPRPSMGSGGMINHDMPPRPPMGSGTMMENDAKGLMLAIGALSPTDRATLIKMIKEYLLSKGIDPTKYAEKRDEIKDIRKDTHTEIKEMRTTTQESVKAKRDEMKMKVWQLHGGNGKVNIQDISMTRGSGMGAGKATFKEFTVTK